MVPASPSFEIVDNLDGTYSARMGFEVDVPWLDENLDDDMVQDFETDMLSCLWWEGTTTCTSNVAINKCDYLASDGANCFIQRDGLTCAGAPYDLGTFSFRAERCGGAGPCGNPFPPQCGVWVDRNDLAFEVTQEMLGCPVEVTDDHDQCPVRRSVGKGATSLTGSASSAGPFIERTDLYYRAAGAGTAGLPGSTTWNTVLGRYWSHTYAQRIVLDPDDSHVWLITDRATFREFGNLSGGVYETLRPSDEYRTLHRIGTTGWELHDLDGTVMEFDTDGLWLSTTDRNGNETTGTYSSGELVQVDLPDGRSEELGYDGGGRLISITEVGTDGTTERTWDLTWTGNDLTRIDRPDGTAWVMTYGDANHPSYLTRLELEGTDNTSTRVESAWEYDPEGNVVKLWRGDTSYNGSNAVEKWAFSFDDATDPTEATVTDPLGDTATYAYDRDPESE
ncbi:MAG TPA: hypothetical protein VKU40_00215, partial [Thermoanaerobaculia bacterium]|nr:hypothetical protein [Thermoanaerobaculia bacterium]